MRAEEGGLEFYSWSWGCVARQHPFCMALYRGKKKPKPSSGDCEGISSKLFAPHLVLLSHVIHIKASKNYLELH